MSSFQDYIFAAYRIVSKRDGLYYIEKLEPESHMWEDVKLPFPLHSPYTKEVADKVLDVIGFVIKNPVSPYSGIKEVSRIDIRGKDINHLK